MSKDLPSLCSDLIDVFKSLSPSSELEAILKSDEKYSYTSMTRTIQSRKYTNDQTNS